ncbi:MAG: WD40/YVTN/BNR-like repeat-containing protein, partial [Longimicrobiales bacterium]
MAGPSGALYRVHADGVYGSADGGRTWTAVPLPPRALERGVGAFDVALDGTFYVGGPSGIAFSDDEGRSWRAPDEAPAPAAIVALAANADSAHIAFAYAPSAGVLRTENGGESWRRMDSGPEPEVRQLMHSDLPGSMNTGWLYAATAEGVYRAMDCFCGWRRSGELPGDSAEVSAVAVDPRTPENVYAAGPAAVFRSRDGGATWERLAAPAADVNGLTVGPVAGEIFAATAGGALYRSADGA